MQHIFCCFLQSYYKIVHLLSVSYFYIIGVKISFLDIAVDLLQKVPNSCGQEIINAINSVNIAYVISVLIFGCSQTQISRNYYFLLLFFGSYQLSRKAIFIKQTDRLKIKLKITTQAGQISYSSGRNPTYSK